MPEADKAVDKKTRMIVASVLMHLTIEDRVAAMVSSIADLHERDLKDTIMMLGGVIGSLTCGLSKHDRGGCSTFLRDLADDVEANLIKYELRS